MSVRDYNTDGVFSLWHANKAGEAHDNILTGSAEQVDAFLVELHQDRPVSWLDNKVVVQGETVHTAARWWQWRKLSEAVANDRA